MHRSLLGRWLGSSGMRSVGDAGRNREARGLLLLLYGVDALRREVGIMHLAVYHLIMHDGEGIAVLLDLTEHHAKTSKGKNELRGTVGHQVSLLLDGHDLG